VRQTVCLTRAVHQYSCYPTRQQQQQAHHTGAKLFYSIGVSYQSFIVFYTVDSVMASKRTITSFFKSETERKDKQPKTRVLVTMSRFPGE